MNAKWSEEMLIDAFSQVARRFGTRETWKGKWTPIKHKDYVIALGVIADELSSKYKQPITAGALRNQVNWAITDQHMNSSQWPTWVRNVRIAFEAKLISRIPSVNPI